MPDGGLTAASVLIAGLLAVSLLTIGGQARALTAHLCRRAGSAVVPVAIAAAIASSLVAIAAGVAAGVPLSDEARPVLAVVALGLGAARLVAPIRTRMPAEPTWSGFASFAVLFAHQLFDAPRLTLFALAAIRPEGSIALTLGAAAGSAISVLASRRFAKATILRGAMAAVLACLAVLIALHF